ncbi:tRNA dihydrouridine synthase DusB [Roseinatronobacter sp. S2]|uniref:tRNA dihydrouridine synthase DusB n=1 Tax=Roseinatronobacter sp. S2 TaxID=3035471 RepID=UPI00240F69A1|nr:tRNA dihydrouridine synthase DusB [Roseinatronobacter sp. S2]WFE76355.1 tRNA dihydrouridine synthase DusB [Roseinatronobacter sp. S2]
MTATNTALDRITLTGADRRVTITPPVLLAPLAGITDLPFRRVVAQFGAGLVVSEMVASQEMVQAKPSMRARARSELGLGEARTAVQIAGRDPHWMAQAARMVADGGAEVIDINMGCPAKKVVGGMSGSALMREPDHALRLIDAVVGAVSIPVTLKTRLGWDDDCLNAAHLVQRAAASGVRMVTIHGRTRCQFYKGQANWRAIGDVVRATHIPVIANGDILCADTARAALSQSGAAGVMVGRGTQGRPWVLAQIAADLFGQPHPDVPTGSALVDLVAAHYEDMLSFYGTALGMKVARKHLGWYAQYAQGCAQLRRHMQTSHEPAQVLRLLPDALSPVADMGVADMGQAA